MSKSKITGKVLSIQLGRKETQIILVGKNAEILHGETVPTPVGAVEDGAIRNPEAVRDMLKTALKLPQFKRVRQAVFTVCTSQVISETVTTPDLPNAKLEKLLQANMDMYFPVDIQDYHLVWQVIGPKDGDSSAKELAVQLWAVPIALLRRYYSVANDCGLSVTAIDYCGHSIATAVGASFARSGGKTRKKLDLNQPITFGRKKKDEESAEPVSDTREARYNPDTDLHVLMERELLGMTFVQNGQVVLQRFVRCGPTPSNQFAELAMMLEYFRTMDIGRGSKIHGIASGFFAADAQMIAELADVLGISFSRFAVPYEIQWCLCMGAARTELDFGISTLNVAGKSHRDLQLQLWQYVLVAGGALAVATVMMFTYSARLNWEAEIKSLETTSQILAVQKAEADGYVNNYNTYKSAYDSYSADWDNTFRYLRAYNDNLVLAMDELEEILPEKSSVLNMQILPNALNVVFACENKEEAAYLIMQLRDMKYAKVWEGGISNLEGGGKGPATTYGSQNTEDTGEAPPAEGSSGMTTIIESALKRKNGALSGITMAQVDALYDACGKALSANSSLSTLINGSSFDERSAALDAMFDDNPFAMKKLMDLLQNNLLILLTQGYYTDLNTAKAVHTGDDSGFVMSDIPDTLDGAWEFKEIYGNVLYQTYGNGAIAADSEERLKNTESLISSDDDLADIYAYYLENDAKTGEYPYLDQAKIEKQAEAGAFTTSDTELNAILNSLIPKSESTIPPTTPPTTPTQETTKPTEETTEPTEETTKPTEETTKPTEETTKPTEETTKPTEETTKPTEETTKPTEETTKPTETTPATERETLDDVTVVEVSTWLQQYFQNFACDNELMNAQIQYFLIGATTDPEILAEHMEACIEAGHIDDELKTLLKGYVYYGDAKYYLDTTNSSLLINAVFKSYFDHDGVTGVSTALDARIQAVLGTIANDVLGDLTGNEEDEKEAGKNGSAGSNAPGVVDTRIRFSVILNYSEEMMVAELERKGLSYSDKIPEKFTSLWEVEE